MSRRTKLPEMSAKEIEGIWAENQYKVENIPGYADAFKQACDSLRGCLDEPSNKQQFENAFERAVADLYLLELEHQYKAEKANGRDD